MPLQLQELVCPSAAPMVAMQKVQQPFSYTITWLFTVALPCSNYSLEH